MTRDLGGNVQTKIEARESTVIHLLEINYWDGVGESQEYVSTAAQPIVTSSDPANLPDAEWTPLGLPGGESALGIGSVTESGDIKAQGIEISLDGVDRTIIDIINQNHFRGRKVRIWRVWLDEDTGEIDDALNIFEGFQNDDFTIEEVPPSIEETGAVTVKTRVTSDLAVLQRIVSVLTNTESHNDMLRRAGLATGDTSFNKVPGITDKIIYWGRPVPQKGGTKSGTGGRGGGDGGGSGHGDDDERRAR